MLTKTDINDTAKAIKASHTAYNENQSPNLFRVDEFFQILKGE